MKPVKYAPLSSAAVVLFGLGLFQPATAQESWTDRISLKGDLRVRYEAIDEDGEEDRHRGRFRTRLSLNADVNENVRAIVRLATGGDNPVSTNQTFDGGFSGKDIGVDQAYVDWTPNDNTHVYAGKMKNPFVRAGGNGLVWDSDLNPEGIAVAYKSGAFFGTAATLFVEERSSADDSVLFAAQGGAKFAVTDGSNLQVGVSYYDYTETVGNLPFYNGRGNGNTVDANGNLVFDYTQVEAFAEWAFEGGDLPASVFVNFVQNTEASANDTGLAIGAKIGKAGNPGTWQASWVWQDLEADAVIATFADSNFGGGGTDATGHILRAKYALADNWTLAANLFLNEVDESIGDEHDYTRLQIDVEFKF